MSTQLLLNPKDADAIAYAYLLPSEEQSLGSTHIAAKLDYSAAYSTARAYKYDVALLGLSGNATRLVRWIAGESVAELVASPRGLHEAIKERMRQRNPSLKTQLSRENIVQLMDKLSKEIAEKNRFATWQEAIASIRGEDRHDSERQ